MIHTFLRTGYKHPSINTTSSPVLDYELGTSQCRGGNQQWNPPSDGHAFETPPLPKARSRMTWTPLVRSPWYITTHHNWQHWNSEHCNNYHHKLSMVPPPPPCNLQLFPSVSDRTSSSIHRSSLDSAWMKGRANSVQKPRIALTECAICGS